MAAITADLCAGWSTTPRSPPSSGHRGIPSPPPGPSSPPPSSSTSPSPSSTASTSSSPLPSSAPSPPHKISSDSPSHSSWPPAAPSPPPPPFPAGATSSASLPPPLPPAPSSSTHTSSTSPSSSSSPTPSHPPRPHPPPPPLLPPCLPPRHRRRHVLPLARSLPVPVTGRDRHQRRRSRRDVRVLLLVQRRVPAGVGQFVFSFAVSVLLLWMQFVDREGEGCSGMGAWCFNASLLGLFINFHLQYYRLAKASKQGKLKAG